MGSNNFDGPILIDDLDATTLASYFGFGRAAGSDAALGPAVGVTNVDPTVSGLAANPGSLALRYTPGSVAAYLKVGGSNTAWAEGLFFRSGDTTSGNYQPVRFQSLDVPYTDLVALGAVLSGTLNLGAALPTNAEVLFARAYISEAFVGCTTLGVKVGIAGTADKYADTMSLLLVGRRRNDVLIVETSDDNQLICTFTATVDNLDQLSAGQARITVAYVLAPEG